MRQTAAGSSGTHSPPGHSNDPRKNQKDGCRRRTTDGNPSPFWQAAGPARASASSFRDQRCHPFDIATATSICLIKQSKAHVLVGLLLISRKPVSIQQQTVRKSKQQTFSSSFFSSFFSSVGAAPPPPPPLATVTAPPPPEGTYGKATVSLGSKSTDVNQTHGSQSRGALSNQL
jgi:hypothetical protein